MDLQIIWVFLFTLYPELLNSGLRFCRVQATPQFAQKEKIKQKGSEEKETFMSF